MFNNSKYSRWYFNIISKAQGMNRRKTKPEADNFVYYERHHISPRSLGGNNSKANLVLLTPKEHFVCHLLLTKMCEDKIDSIRMCYAFLCLGNRRTQKEKWITARQYHLFRTVFILKISGPNHPLFGKPKGPFSKETLAKMSKAALTPERMAIAKSNLEKAFANCSTEGQFKKGAVPWNKGKKCKPNSPEQKLAQSIRMKGGKHPRAVPVIIDGKFYPSIQDAANAYNLDNEKIRTRLASPKKRFANWVRA